MPGPLHRMTRGRSRRTRANAARMARRVVKTRGRGLANLAGSGQAEDGVGGPSLEVGVGGVRVGEGGADGSLVALHFGDARVVGVGDDVRAGRSVEGRARGGWRTSPRCVRRCRAPRETGARGRPGGGARGGERDHQRAEENVGEDQRRDDDDREVARLGVILAPAVLEVTNGRWWWSSEIFGTRNPRHVGGACERRDDRYLPMRYPAASPKYRRPYRPADPLLAHRDELREHSRRGRGDRGPLAHRRAVPRERVVRFLGASDAAPSARRRGRARGHALLRRVPPDLHTAAGHMAASPVPSSIPWFPGTSRRRRRGDRISDALRGRRPRRRRMHGRRVPRMRAVPGGRGAEVQARQRRHLRR